MFHGYEIKKNVVLRNKFVVAPMTTWASNEDLTVSQDELRFYAARAEDAGMVITASAHILPDGQTFENQIYAGDDAYIPSLKQLAETIKIQGAKAVLQLQHGGRLSIVECDRLVSASAVKASYIPGRPGEITMTPRELMDNEIEEIIEAFYRATCRAIEAGFDGVEIHGAGTYLVQQFFSPQSNQRQDGWGGPLENRMRFPLKVVEAVNRAKKQYGGERFITGYRFAPEERDTPGITLEDTFQLIDHLSETEIDYLHVSSLDYKATSQRDKSDTRQISKLLLERLDRRKPLIGNGGITSFQDACDALFNIGFDLVSIGRSILYDPFWIRKKKSEEQVYDAIHLSKLDEQHIPNKMAISMAKLQHLKIEN